MKYSIDKKDHYTVFKLNEENLNSLIAPDVKSEFVFFRNEGIQHLIFDVSDVKYVDSSGLSAILTANRIWNNFGNFILTGVDSPMVKKLIEISRLETILTIIPTVSEASDYIRMEMLAKDIEED